MANQFGDFFKELFGNRQSAEVPLIPLRDTVVFPRIAVPIIVRRKKSLKALEEAMRHNRVAIFAAQKSPDAEEVALADVHGVGTLVKIREVVKQEDKSVRVLADGVARARISAFVSTDPFVKAKIEPLVEPSVKKTEKIEASMYSVLNQFRRVVNMGANVPFDILLVILNVTDPWLLCDLIAANLELKVEEKQEVLEAATADAKLESVGKALGRQIKVLQMASKIQAETGKELDKMQREVFLREQMKSIEKELEGIGGTVEADELKERLEKAGLPPAVKEKAMKEYDRMKAMPSFSPEISYLRTYLEWVCDLPWSVMDKSVIDIAKAKKILDEDHYGLDKVKERILDYLSVQKLVGKMRGQILCFVGPPGTGKTSIGKSIARACGRKFFRMSLGGIRDEAEIRGHRRTYVGALPGRILQGMATVKTRNPVFMLDEIDKVGADFRGDPSAALLEALDPEQNNSFSDHYLEMPFDLSDVLFITTANLLDTVPPALRDRMEVIEFPGYTEDEKLNIAKRHLIPKQIKDNGLEKSPPKFTDGAVLKIIRSYTGEAGVRGLERSIAAICRKSARKLAEGGKADGTVDEAAVGELLGPEKFSPTDTGVEDTVGVVTGLAWTETGGDILQIEATRMPGKGQLMLTGHLGQVMQESAQAAFSFVRSSARELGIKETFFKNSDVHVHVPAGAIPKDGPSAGVAMAMAIISMLKNRPARRDVALTGEITLRGRVLEVGGIKEKVLAAHRYGLKTVVLPDHNRKDLVDVPEEVRKKLNFVFVKNASEAAAAVMAKPDRAGRRPPAPRRRR